MRPSSSSATSESRPLRLRPAGPGDAAFLAEMLAEAASWGRPPGEAPPGPGDVLATPQVADYVEDWGRDGDGGVIAEWDGEPVGACWFRRFTAAHPGYGFLGVDVPGIGLAVREGFRRRGVGSRLLEAAVSAIRESGAPAVGLSVELGNGRARRLYDRAGFEPLGREGGSMTMRLRLRDHD
jgi:ribosomal protein S18 acetylase RimI-like enzyme